MNVEIVRNTRRTPRLDVATATLLPSKAECSSLKLQLQDTCRSRVCAEHDYRCTRQAAADLQWVQFLRCKTKLKGRAADRDELIRRHASFASEVSGHACVTMYAAAYTPITCILWQPSIVQRVSRIQSSRVCQALSWRDHLQSTGSATLSDLLWRSAVR